MQASVIIFKDRKSPYRKEQKMIEQLYIKYSKDMMKYALSLLRNYHDAEDAVSECYLRLMRSQKRVCGIPEERRKAYVAAVLRNICRDMLAYRRSTVYTEEIEEPSVSAQTDSAELNTDIACAIDKIKAKNRDVIRLKFFCDYKIRDISSMLGLSESNVKIIIHRGKEQLVRLLGEKYAEAS